MNQSSPSQRLLSAGARSSNAAVIVPAVPAGPGAPPLPNAGAAAGAAGVVAGVVAGAAAGPAAGAAGAAGAAVGVAAAAVGGGAGVGGVARPSAPPLLHLAVHQNHLSVVEVLVLIHPDPISWKVREKERQRDGTEMRENEREKKVA